MITSGSVSKTCTGTCNVIDLHFLVPPDDDVTRVPFFCHSKVNDITKKLINSQEESVQGGGWG